MPYSQSPSAPTFTGHPASANNTTTASGIVQAAHGFLCGQVLYHDGSKFQLALNNNAETLGYHVVAEVVDADTFRLAFDGEILSCFSGLMPGSWYGSSPTIAGGIAPISGQTAAPAGGIAHNPVGQAISATQLLIKSYEPIVST